MSGINGIGASSASHLTSGAQHSPAASQGADHQSMVRAGGGEFKPVEGLKEPGSSDFLKGLTDMFKGVLDAVTNVVKSGLGAVGSLVSEISSLAKSAK